MNLHLRHATASLVRTGFILAIALLAGACGKSPPPAPASPETPVPSGPAVSPPHGGAAPAEPQPVPTAAESESPDRPRPRVLLWVEGSPHDDTIWRGWPVLVRVQTLAGDPPADLSMRGPAPVTVTRAAAVWLLADTESAQLAPGHYTLSAGDQSIEVAVTDAPRELTAEQRSVRSRLQVHSAVASGDVTAAQQAADAWMQVAPDSFGAREALGDLLRARGDAAGALDAYNAALQRVPRGIDPPPASLHAKIAALLRERAAALPARPAVEPPAGTVRYHELIDAGDRALAAGDRAAASQRYAEADAWHRDRTLTLSSTELDEKRATLDVASAASAPERAAAPARSAVVPTAPSTSAGSSAAMDAGAAPGTIGLAPGLTDATIIADAAGQWAASATASSQYGAPRYGAVQATGAPNIALGMAGDNPDAWCPAGKNDGTAWLELTFGRPVHATEVRVRQNNAPGAIAKIEAIDEHGTAHVWWEGVDPFVAPAIREIAWFAVRVPKTDYLVAKVRITFNLAAVPGWKQIDAVQLVGSAP